MATLAPGTQFGEYRIEQVLARGGMGVVYKATRTRTGQVIALKCIAPERAADPAYRQRFVREATVLVGLQHPRIVPLIDWGEADGVLYLALAYLDGPNLERLIEQDGPFSLARTLDLLAPVAEALDAAHRRGYVHRDVKPANIMLDGEGNVYLTDFGLGKLAGSSGLSSANFAIGTLAYMSPEQFTGKVADPALASRTDIYALGCVFHACLTRQDVVATDDFARAMHAHVEEAPPRLSLLRPSLPRALDDVQATVLAKDPSGRYATASAFIAAARAVLVANPEPLAVFEPVPPAPTTRARIIDVIGVPPPTLQTVDAPAETISMSASAPPVPAPPAQPVRSGGPTPRNIGLAVAGAAMLGLVALGGLFAFGGRPSASSPPPSSAAVASGSAQDTRSASPSPSFVAAASVDPGDINDPASVRGTWPVDAATVNSWIPAAVRSLCDPGSDNAVSHAARESYCALDSIKDFKGTGVNVAYYFFTTEAAARSAYEELLTHDKVWYGAGDACPVDRGERTWNSGGASLGHLYCRLEPAGGGQAQYFQTYFGMPIVSLFYRVGTDFVVLDKAWRDHGGEADPDTGSTQPITIGSSAVPTASPAPAPPGTATFEGSGSKTGESFVLSAGTYRITTTVELQPECSWRAYLDGWQTDPLAKQDPSGGSGSGTSDTTLTLASGTYSLRVESTGCGAWTMKLAPS